MEEALAAALEDLGMVDCGERLTQMGVVKRSDISYLKDEDLKEAGFTLVQTRKLQRAAADGDEEKSPETKDKRKQGSLAKVREDEEERMGSSEEEEGEESQGVPHSLSVSNWSRVSSDGMYIEAQHVDRGTRPTSASKRRSSEFWTQQLKGRPMRLIFVRHGESEANVDRTITTTVPDHMLHLTESGRQQALDAGTRLKGLVGDQSVKFTVSPYVRTRETLNGILQAWKGCPHKIPIREDVRIREQEYGNFDDPDIHSLHREKRKFGAFYYRFPAGESPADCFDRASLFLESMYRSWNDNHSENQVVVCHGMMILVTLMRLLRLSIEEFDNLDSLRNCEFVVLERPVDDAKYSIAFTWAAGQPRDYRGLRRKPKSDRPPLDIWDGSPDAPLLTNKPTSRDSTSTVGC